MSTVPALRAERDRLDADIDATRRAVESVRRVLAARRPVPPATLSTGHRIPENTADLRTVLGVHQSRLSQLLAQRDRVASSLNSAKAAQ